MLGTTTTQTDSFFVHTLGFLSGARFVRIPSYDYRVLPLSMRRRNESARSKIAIIREHLGGGEGLIRISSLGSEALDPPAASSRALNPCHQGQQCFEVVGPGDFLPVALEA